MIRAIDGERLASEVASKGEAATRKAVELEDSPAVAHAALAGWYFCFARDLQRADAKSKWSVELAPPANGVSVVRDFRRDSS